MRRLQSGLAAVELAIILPVFLMLMLGTAELGRACYQYNTLTKAVREGARFLSARALNGAGVMALGAEDEATARRVIVYGSPAGGDAPRLPDFEVGDVAITSVASAGGTHVVITATYGYTPMFATIPAFGRGPDIASAGTMTASSSMVAM